MSSKSGSKRWVEGREREFIDELSTPDQPEEDRKEVPTLEEFAPRFLDNHARVNRQKPSTVAAKESIIRVHLIPLVGSKKLNKINNEDVQSLKTHLYERAPATVNTVLTTLSVMLKTAVEWNIVERMPCVIGLLPVSQSEASFHGFGDYDALAEEADKLGRNAHLVVLLGGEAGLRMGEMLALEWKDVDFSKRQLHVRQSEWRGHVTVPKGGRTRFVPMTVRLTEALQRYRHLRSERVLCEDDGTPLTKRIVQRWVAKASGKANLEKTGVHILRHTFCSNLAMRGAAVPAIQKLAGHRDLKETQRYLHLSPAAIEGAIRLLEQRETGSRFGDVLETVIGEKAKSDS